MYVILPRNLLVKHLDSLKNRYFILGIDLSPVVEIFRSRFPCTRHDCCELETPSHCYCFCNKQKKCATDNVLLTLTY